MTIETIKYVQGLSTEKIVEGLQKMAIDFALGVMQPPDCHLFASLILNEAADRLEVKDENANR